MTTPSGEQPDDFRGYDSLAGLQDEDAPGAGSLYGKAEQARLNFASVLDNIFGDIVGAIADALFPDISSGEGALADIEDGQNEVQLNLGRLSGYCNLTMSHNWQTGDGLFQEYTPWTALPFDTYIGSNVGAKHSSALHQSDGTSRHGISIDRPGTWIIGSQVTVGAGNGEGYSEIELAIRYYDTNGDSHDYSASRFSVRHGKDFYSYYVQKPVMIPDNGNTYYALCMIRHRNSIWWPTRGGSLWSSFSAFRLDKKTDRDQPGNDAPDGGKYH